MISGKYKQVYTYLTGESSPCIYLQLSGIYTFYEPLKQAFTERKPVTEVQGHEGAMFRIIEEGAIG